MSQNKWPLLNYLCFYLKIKANDDVHGESLEQSHFKHQSVDFSCSFVSNSLWLHGLQHAWLLFSSPTHWVYPNLCLLSQWCHPTVSSPVFLFSPSPQFFPALGSFQMSQFFTSGGQIIEVSASTSVFPMNFRVWFPLGWTDWIPLQSKELSRSSPTLQFKSINSSVLSLFYSPTLIPIHDYWKKHSFD